MAIEPGSPGGFPDKHGPDDEATTGTTGDTTVGTTDGTTTGETPVAGE